VSRSIPRKFGVADLRERINVETATVDESSGQPIRTWATTYASEPAKWTPTNGGEVINGKIVEAGVNAVFTIHRRDNISPVDMRITHTNQSTTYGIAYVHPVGGGLRYLDLHCKTIKE
jgi:hypothetical protein